MAEWREKVEVNRLITAWSMTDKLSAVTKAVADELRKSKTFRERGWEIIERIEAAEDIDEANEALEAMFDFADGNRVWLGFGGEQA